MMMIGILPTLTEQLLNGDGAVAPTRATSCSTSRSSPPAGRTCEINIDGRRAAGDLRRHDRPRGRVHERPAAPAGRPGAVRRALERGAGDRRHPAGDRRQLAVLLRPRAVARDADRAVRADHRHAPGGAQGPGRAPARVVRRALDHVDLRPLRGERPLLPGAAAGGRGRGPDGGARGGGAPQAAGAAAAQRHDLPLEPPDLRRRRAAARTCAWRTACCRPARRSSTRSPTPPSTTGSCACWSRTSARSGRRCRSRAAEENFYAGARDGHRRARLLARRRRGAGDRARPAPAAADGPRGPRPLGRRHRRRRPPAGDHRAPLRRAASTAPPGRRPRSTASTSASTAPTRCAR